MLSWKNTFTPSLRQGLDEYLFCVQKYFDGDLINFVKFDTIIFPVPIQQESFRMFLISNNGILLLNRNTFLFFLTLNYSRFVVMI